MADFYIERKTSTDYIEGRIGITEIVSPLLNILNKDFDDIEDISWEHHRYQLKITIII